MIEYVNFLRLTVFFTVNSLGQSRAQHARLEEALMKFALCKLCFSRQQKAVPETRLNKC